MSWRRLLAAQRVLVSVTDRGMVCSWQSKSPDPWVWRRGVWSPDSCRDGFPLQQEEMGELLADLLLDCDVLGAEIELILPSAACGWRVLDGFCGNDLEPASLSPHQLACLDWSLDPEDVDVCVVPCGDVALAVGVQRPLLQAWIDVMEVADLPLRRVEWSVAAALRTIQAQTQASVDLAWLMDSGQDDDRRLVLLHRGIPEVDRLIRGSEALNSAVQSTIAAWRLHNPAVGPLSWWLSLQELSGQDTSSGQEDTTSLDPNALAELLQGDPLVAVNDLWTPVAWDPELDKEPLDPLEHLALSAVRDLEP